MLYLFLNKHTQHGSVNIHMQSYFESYNPLKQSNLKTAMIFISGNVGSLEHHAVIPERTEYFIISLWLVKYVDVNDTKDLPVIHLWLLLPTPYTILHCFPWSSRSTISHHLYYTTYSVSFIIVFISCLSFIQVKLAHTRFTEGTPSKHWADTAKYSDPNPDPNYLNSKS